MNQEHATAEYAAPSKKFFIIHLVVFLIAITALWINYYLVNKAAHGAAYPWECWITGAWFIALTGHFCNTYFDSNKNHSDKQYEKYLYERSH